MSSEVLQLIVHSLNAEPFNQNETVISFDSKQPHSLLQTLSDVICWIVNMDRIDIRDESAEQTALRILHHLKILKFRPPGDIEELEDWRAGVVEGSKRSIYPVLFYLFSNVDMLKQRAYLAKYLIKVEVPSDVHDMETAQMQNDIAQMMERFKEAHARAMEVSKETLILEDIKNDLKSMANEKEALTRKIEKAHRKIQNIPNLDRYIRAAEDLRKEKERLSELAIQKVEQRNAVIHVEQKLHRLKAQLAEARKQSEEIDPRELIEQLQDEIATNQYLVNTKLSKEIETKRKMVAELSKISDMPAIDNNDIEKLKQEIEARTNRVMALEEERDKSEEGYEDNFSIFRHQAATVERKKAAAAQRLLEMRHELSTLEAQVNQRKEEIRNKTGKDVMSAVQFRKYISEIRNQKQEYKSKKAIFDAMTVERQTLSRTVDILSFKYEKLKERIEGMGQEVDENIFVAVPTRPRTAAPKSEDTDELRRMASKLMSDLDNIRETVEPLKRQKEARQQDFNEINDMVRSQKSEFERRRMQLESGFSDLKEEVDSLEARYRSATEEIDKLESRTRELKEQIEIMERDRDGDGGTSAKEELEAHLRKVQEEYEELMARGGGVTGGMAERQQVIMWKALLELFQSKISLMEDK